MEKQPQGQLVAPVAGNETPTSANREPVSTDLDRKPRGAGRGGRSLMARFGAVLARVFAGLGFATMVLLAVGIVADYRGFDRTRGGYEPPYTGCTGEPID